MVRVMAEDPLSRRYPGAVTYRLGTNADLCDALIALVRLGRKRATCTAQAEIDAGEPPAEIGRCDIIEDFSGVPQLVIRTLEMRHVRFDEMTEQMVRVLGVDETLPAWRVSHRRYYRKLGIFDPAMALVWERFELVEDLA
jgi:uncharacterized protein YhfF